MFLQCYISKFDARSKRRMWISQSEDIKSARENYVTIGYYTKLKAFTSSTVDHLFRGSITKGR
jgi:hypothetical protein